jgi:hypothetical protein
MKKPALLIILLLFIFSVTPCIGKAGTAATGKHPLTEAQVIDYAKKLDVSRLDTRLPSQPLEKWLKMVLKPGARITWESNDCGEQPGFPEPGRVYPSCAGIQAVSGTFTINIEIGVGSEKCFSCEPGTWWVAVTKAGCKAEYLKKLSDLPERIKASPQSHRVTEKTRIKK